MARSSCVAAASVLVRTIDVITHWLQHSMICTSAAIGSAHIECSLHTVSNIIHLHSAPVPQMLICCQVNKGEVFPGACRRERHQTQSVKLLPSFSSPQANASQQAIIHRAVMIKGHSFHEQVGNITVFDGSQQDAAPS